ncbi:P1 family peptidase [Microbacterium sp. NIBRBAC000506063]|nr:P1 family peptidase [Microbacterium sp. NIBRBAC000506063]
MDVSGIAIGNVSVSDSSRDVHTGVTAIVHERLTRGKTLPAGFHCGNGYGKFVGSTQVQELGTIETPMLLTSTLSTFRVADALISWLQRRERRSSVNPVVGEINDSWLSPGADRPIEEAHVFSALDGADDGALAVGAVGAGTGACALGFKSGIGSASRLIEVRGEQRTVGALVLSNMTGQLRIGGRVVTPESLQLPAAGPLSEVGSCVTVVAVDFPASAVELTRFARRAVFGIGRAGAGYSHGSGDYALAFSADPTVANPLSETDLDRIFTAVLDCVEESVIGVFWPHRQSLSAPAAPHTPCRFGTYRSKGRRDDGADTWGARRDGAPRDRLFLRGAGSSDARVARW